MKNNMLEELMSIDVNNLKEKQYNALKEHAITVLVEIIDDLRHDKLNEIILKLSYSPAGDEMGCDNYFINFSWNSEDEPSDLNDIINMLYKLK